MVVSCASGPGVAVAVPRDANERVAEADELSNVELAAEHRPRGRRCRHGESVEGDDVGECRESLPTADAAPARRARRCVNRHVQVAQVADRVPPQRRRGRAAEERVRLDHARVLASATPRLRAAGVVERVRAVRWCACCRRRCAHPPEQRREVIRAEATRLHAGVERVGARERRAEPRRERGRGARHPLMIRALRHPLTRRCTEGDSPCQGASGEKALIAFRWQFLSLRMPRSGVSFHLERRGVRRARVQVAVLVATDATKRRVLPPEPGGREELIALRWQFLSLRMPRSGVSCHLKRQQSLPPERGRRTAQSRSGGSFCRYGCREAACPATWSPASPTRAPHPTHDEAPGHTAGGFVVGNLRCRAYRGTAR